MLLKIGKTGPEVRNLHKNLMKRGYFGDDFDKATREAVKLFQASKGLLVDGIAGNQTLGVLNSTHESQKRSKQIIRALEPVVVPEIELDDVPEHVFTALTSAMNLGTGGQWNQILAGQMPTPKDNCAHYGRGRGLYLIEEKARAAMLKGLIPKFNLEPGVGVWVAACSHLSLGGSAGFASGRNGISFHCSSFVNWVLSIILGYNETYTHAGNRPPADKWAQWSRHKTYRVSKTDNGRARGYAEHLARLAPDGTTAKQHGLRGRAAKKYMDAEEIWRRRGELPTVSVFVQSTDTNGRKAGGWKWEHHVGFIFRLPQWPDKLIRVAADGYKGSGGYSRTPLNIEVIGHAEALKIEDVRLYNLFRVHGFSEDFKMHPIVAEIPR